MIAHISVGVRDIDRSKRFYDAVLEPLEYTCLRDRNRASREKRDRRCSGLTPPKTPAPESTHRFDAPAASPFTPLRLPGPTAPPPCNDVSIPWIAPIRENAY
jgi:hypothetical protein